MWVDYECEYMEDTFLDKVYCSKYKRETTTEECKNCPQCATILHPDM